MRGLAAAGVLVSHVAFATGAVGAPLWGGWLSRLEGFVNVFFVLSGFVLFRPYVVAAARGGAWPATGRYVIRRALRILPAYWVLVGVCLLVLLDEAPDPLTWLRHLTLGQYFVAAPFVPGVAIAWTLAVEVVFYALLPVVAFLLLRRRGVVAYRRWRPGRSVAFLVVVGLAVSVGWLSQLRPGRLNVYLHTMWFPSFAMCFAVGMAMAVASVALRTSTAPRAWAVLDEIGRAPWVCWGIAAELYALSVYLAGPLGGLGIPTAGNYITKELLFLGFATLLLLPVVFGRGEAVGGTAGSATGLGLLLSQPALRWLGTVSYGLFLWHLTVIEVIAAVDGPLWGASTGRLLLLTLAGGLVLAAASWYIVERPAQRLGERLVAPVAVR